jgi:hypothetical protein
MNWAQVDFWEGGTAYEWSEKGNKNGIVMFKKSHHQIDHRQALTCLSSWFKVKCE